MDSIVDLKNKKIINKKSFLIPVEGLFSDFDKHLNIENNKRIFFSGKFGIGKTFFLHEFFKNYKDNYEVFHLFPVNYQISSNEDIIELLKYDILIELLKKDNSIFEKKREGFKEDFLLFYTFCREKFTINNSLQSFISAGESLTTFTGDFNLTLLSKLGQPLNLLLKFDEEFQKIKKEYKSGEKDIIEKFIKEMRDRSVSETDCLSYLLSKNIEKQKNSKKSVLVLDDLDRIDPEHIFRILNVFSAHFDISSGGNDLPNKFGFDKVVLVGDSKNIESIFSHRYGKDTDFDGYFNKFCSNVIYVFDNDKIISDYVEDLISELGTKDDGSIFVAMQKSGWVRVILTMILKDAILLSSKEKINLRQLLRLSRFNHDLIASGKYTENNSFYPRDRSILKHFNFSVKTLLFLYDSKEKLCATFQKIKDIPHLEDEEDKRSYFSLLSKFLLEVILKRQFNEGVSVEDWSGYKITIKADDHFRPINIEQKEGITTKSLFYDLLVEYIKGENYKKNLNEW